MSARGIVLVVSLLALLAAAPAGANDEQDYDVLELLAAMEQAWLEIDDYSKLVDKTERLVNGDV
ncbi:MAG: hypothetical protein QNI96_11890, partial [Woeseiaceae bacterium]|nr:hypothetical protein [Woeseiaceae bacterium]